MFGRLLGCYTIYTLSGALDPWRNFAWCKIHFTSKSCVLLYWQRSCTALQRRKILRDTLGLIRQRQVHTSQLKQSSLHLKIDPAEFCRSDISRKTWKRQTARLADSASRAVCRFHWFSGTTWQFAKCWSFFHKRLWKHAKVQAILISLSNSAKASHKRCT